MKFKRSNLIKCVLVKKVLQCLYLGTCDGEDIPNRMALFGSPARLSAGEEYKPSISQAFLRGFLGLSFSLETPAEGMDSDNRDSRIAPACSKRVAFPPWDVGSNLLVIV